MKGPRASPIASLSGWASWGDTQQKGQWGQNTGGMGFYYQCPGVGWTKRVEWKRDRDECSRCGRRRGRLGNWCKTYLQRCVVKKPCAEIRLCFIFPLLWFNTFHFGIQFFCFPGRLWIVKRMMQNDELNNWQENPYHSQWASLAKRLFMSQLQMPSRP